MPSVSVSNLYTYLITLRLSLLYCKVIHMSTNSCLFNSLQVGLGGLRSVNDDRDPVLRRGSSNIAVIRVVPNQEHEGANNLLNRNQAAPHGQNQLLDTVNTLCL